MGISGLDRFIRTDGFAAGARTERPGPAIRNGARDRAISNICTF